MVTGKANEAVIRPHIMTAPIAPCWWSVKAVCMLQNGADIVTIGECLGHASLSNTQKYTHLALVDIIDAYNIAHRRA